MQRLKEFWERLKSIWGNMSLKKKVALISVSATLIVFISFYYILFGKTTYAILFTDLSIEDSGHIITTLDEMTVDYKIEDKGSTITVPEEQVDRLRISLANEGALPSGSKGFELFDNSGFALTNEEREIMYQRALQGELQRAIMSMEEVEFASVLLSMPKESLFSEDEEKGSASIVIRMKKFKTMSPEKVRGIIALVSGAVKDIPPENIEVVDTELNYLSFGLNDDEDFYSAKETNSRMTLKKAFEDTLEEDMKKMLETALGRGKIVVKIHADMNFDTQETTSIVYDYENPVIVSIQESISLSDGENIDLSLSPVDNNTQYYGDNTDEIAGIPGLETYDNTRNYEIGETTTKIIKAPGVVERITTSVIYDGELSDSKKEAVRNIVVAAVGFNETRGDMIHVEGLAFDRTSEEELKRTLEEAEEKYQAEIKKKEWIKYIILAALGGLIVIALISFMLKKRGQSRLALRELASMEANGIQPMAVEEMIKDISLKYDNNLSDAEEEIQKYAKESPEKVADVIRTWILQEEA